MMKPDRINFFIQYVKTHNVTKLRKVVVYDYCFGRYCSGCKLMIDCDNIFGGRRPFLTIEEYNFLKQNHPEHFI